MFIIAVFAIAVLVVGFVTFSLLSVASDADDASDALLQKMQNEAAFLQEMQHRMACDVRIIHTIQN